MNNGFLQGARMDKSEAINDLQEKIVKIKTFQDGNFSISSPEFKKWQRDTEVLIECIFGVHTRHIADFKKVRFSPMRVTFKTVVHDHVEAFNEGIETVSAILESFIDEIDKYWENGQHCSSNEVTSIDKIIYACERFHLVAKQLRDRYNDRETISIEDEYDVQDVLHVLLKLYFDDIRSEEWTPSYAGSSSRMDFLLKQERIVIETKKTRKGLTGKEIGEQLIVDIEKYKAHPECKTLLCFVYDPEGRIVNPVGIENDLGKEREGLKVIVIVSPKGF